MVSAVADDWSDFQAARVTNAAERLKDTGPEIRARPLQYMNTPQLELDSYIQLTQAARLRVGQIPCVHNSYRTAFVITFFVKKREQMLRMKHFF